MTYLPNYKILDWKMDTLPREQLIRLQGERLAAIVRYVYANTDFWRRKFDAAGVGPADINSIEDLHRVPFCTKKELQEDQAKNPPFGSYVGTPRSHWFKMTATSGTTGTPLRRVYSARDWGYVLDRFQRNPVVGPGDMVMVMSPTDGLIGPTLGAAAAERCGALVIYAGRYSTKQRLQMLLELRPKTVSGTASYLLHLLEVAGESGIDLREAGVQILQSVGEPGAAVDATRARLHQGWGANVIDGFGLAEIFPLGGSRLHSTDIHIASDMALVEILDPSTGTPVPRGEAGELVVTNLVGDTQPLLRYRTGDLVRQALDDVGADGFTGTRLVGGIIGRIDDMVWFRGANIYPSAIEQTIRSFPELGPEFQVVISGSNALPTLTVKVEPAGNGRPLAESVIRRLSSELDAAIRVHAAIEIAEAGTLPRVDEKGKARRIIDQRLA
ncbi:MAG: AMP-binding protein [Bradyrhizobiaceae bacterium]|nr:AMP-binding protein [Bradyrhizobiaceae bacterium]